MRKISWAFVGTIFIFFFSFIVIAPIITNIGYSSVEGSYHAVTHAILILLIFTVIVCTIKEMLQVYPTKAICIACVEFLAFG